MTIKIKALARVNPRDIEAPKKYYATVVNDGEFTLNSLSKQIAQMSTVSKTDVLAVLSALTEVIPNALEDGKIIRLGSLGSFSILVNSEPSLSPEEVTFSNVKQRKLRFRPSLELKKLVDGFPLEKIS